MMSKGAFAAMKHETSSQKQLTAQSYVLSSFNCQVRADLKGPNPGYKKDTPPDAAKYAKSRGKSYSQATPTMQLTPYGVRTSAHSQQAHAPTQERIDKRIALLKSFGANNSSSGLIPTSKVNARQNGDLGR